MEMGHCKKCGNGSFHIQNDLCATCFNAQTVAQPSNKVEELRRAQDDVARLRKEIEVQQRNCSHDWGDTVSDPIITPRSRFSHYEGHGSDPNPIHVPDGHDTKPRWSRTCKRCGKVEYTEKRKAVETKPDFD